MTAQLTIAEVKLGLKGRKINRTDIRRSSSAGAAEFSSMTMEEAMALVGPRRARNAAKKAAQTAIRKAEARASAATFKFSSAAKAEAWKAFMVFQTAIWLAAGTGTLPSRFQGWPEAPKGPWRQLVLEEAFKLLPANPEVGAALFE